MNLKSLCNPKIGQCFNKNMVELRCNDCKRVFQYSGEDRFYTKCPQCNARVQIANPRNFGRNDPEVFK